MKRAFTLLLTIVPLTLFAQVQLERSVIGSTGGDAESGDLHVSHTVGEAVVTTESSSTIILTQGFHQPTDFMIGIESAEHGVSITAFPNPTEGTVVLDLTTEKPHEFHVEVFDATGKRVLSNDNFTARQEHKHTVDLSTVASGNYFIRLSTTEDDFQKSLKVQKIK